jgi:hypothetical protein
LSFILPGLAKTHGGRLGAPITNDPHAALREVLKRDAEQAGL